MNTKNNVLVDVSPFLLFEASADSETREEGGHVGYDDKGHGNDAESTSQVTGGLADFDSVEMEEEEEKEEELVTGEKEEEHEEEEVNSHVRWPEKRENESGSVDASSTRNDESLVVKLEINEDGGADVHFKAFQMSDMYVREGWFEMETGPEDDPKLSKMKKEVVVGVRILKKSTRISSSSSSRSWIIRKKASDLYFDVASDVPALAECVRLQSHVPEGYELLIDYMANIY
ncbi:hypothetical protein YC2023_111327 [Brassica napus]